IYAIIYKLLKTDLGNLFKVLSNSIKNHDCIIYGIPNYGKECSNYCKCELFISNRDGTKCYKNVMYNCDDGTESKFEFKPNHQVQEYYNPTQNDLYYRLL